MDGVKACSFSNQKKQRQSAIPGKSKTHKNASYSWFMKENEMWPDSESFMVCKENPLDISGKKTVLWVA